MCVLLRIETVGVGNTVEGSAIRQERVPPEIPNGKRTPIRASAATISGVVAAIPHSAGLATTLAITTVSPTARVRSSATIASRALGCRTATDSGEDKAPDAVLDGEAGDVQMRTLPALVHVATALAISVVRLWPGHTQLSNVEPDRVRRRLRCRRGRSNCFTFPAVYFRRCVRRRCTDSSRCPIASKTQWVRCVRCFTSVTNA